MKKLFFIVAVLLSLNSFAQELVPVTEYDGGYLYVIQSDFTKEKKPFLYSRCSGKAEGSDYISEWFTVFDSDLRTVTSGIIPIKIHKYQVREVKENRRFFSNSGGGITKTQIIGPTSYFLDDEWMTVSDDTLEYETCAGSIIGSSFFGMRDNFITNSIYLTQTMFDDDEDFEYLYQHYEVVPLDSKSEGQPDNIHLSYDPLNAGVYYDYYDYEYSQELQGYIFTLYRTTYYGGIQQTGTDVCSLSDGSVKNTLSNITDVKSAIVFESAVYIAGYDLKTNTYCLYRIDKGISGVERVAQISDEMQFGTMYSIQGIPVSESYNGIKLSNGLKFLNR